MKVRVLQFVDEEVKYDEIYETDHLDDLKSDLDELIGSAIDRYEIEEI